MTSTSTMEGIPQQANLLACKQWWKVCFLYGDQEKYYRQVYGKAASQRLAMSSNHQEDTQPSESSASTTTTTDDKRPFVTLPTLFPMKHPSRRRSKTHSTSSDRHQQKQANIIHHSKPDIIQPNSKVTVLDDPFLFGVNEYANLSEDSGIDNAAFEHHGSQGSQPSKRNKQFGSDVISDLSRRSLNVNGNITSICENVERPSMVFSDTTLRNKKCVGNGLAEPCDDGASFMNSKKE